MNNYSAGRRRLARLALTALAGLAGWTSRADETRPAPPSGLKKRSKESVGYRDCPYGWLVQSVDPANDRMRRGAWRVIDRPNSVAYNDR
jgi:hypothetical protein